MAYKLPSNIEYLGQKPNFTRDSYPTLASMEEALALGHIDPGHLSYCQESGVTYKAVLDQSTGTMSWKDILGDIRSEYLGIIEDTEKVAAEAFWDLDSRLKDIKESITELSADVQTLLDWYNGESGPSDRPKMGTCVIDGPEQPGLRGSEFTWTITWTWTHAESSGLTGLTYGDTTLLLSDLGLQDTDTGTWAVTGTGTYPETITAGWFGTTEFQGATREFVDIPEVRTMAVSGLPGFWDYLDTDPWTTPITMKASGSGLTIGETITGGPGNEVVGTVDLTDSWSTTQDFEITGITTDTYTWRWSGETLTVDPCLAVLMTRDPSSPAAPTMAGLLGQATSGFKSYTGTGVSEIIFPDMTYTGTEEVWIISGLDIRAWRAWTGDQDSAWDPDRKFVESGQLRYQGKPFYYIKSTSPLAGTYQIKIER